MINLDLYRVFYLTAQEQSFSKAAKKLFLTQPSVSQSIKQLEEKLALKLFIRTSKGVELTQEGGVLFSHLKQAFASINTAEEKLGEVKRRESGDVSLGASDSLCKHYLFPAIRSYQQLFPGIKIKLRHGSTPEILEHLNNGRIDLGLVHLPVPETDYEVIDFLQMNSTFVVGQKFKHLSEANISIEKLLSYPMISFSESSRSRHFLEQLFHQYGRTVVPDIEVGSVELLIEAVLSDMGVAFVTREYVAVELAQNVLYEVNVKEEIQTRKVGIARKKGMTLSVAAADFQRHLQELVYNM